MSSRKSRYLTKTVDFNGEELTLFSLDGATWSSRKDELTDIHERHEDRRITFEEIRSGVVNKKKNASKNANSAEQEKSSPAPKPRKRGSSHKAAAKGKVSQGSKKKSKVA